MDPDASVESAGIAPPTNDTSVVLDQEDDGEGDLQASYDGELSIGEASPSSSAGTPATPWIPNGSGYVWSGRIQSSRSF